MKFFSLKILSIGLVFLASKTCEQGTLQSNNEIIKTEFHKDSLLNALYPSPDIVIANHTDFTKKHYPERIAEFKKNPLEKQDIVFLGNSITEKAGDWAKRFNNSKIKNRGIAGDTSDGVLARLDEIIYYEPKQVFILIGINDIFREDSTPEKVFENIIKIVNKINLASPRTKIYVHTILPTSTEKIREKIQKTNTLLINAQKKQPYQIILLHDEFANENDLMNMDLSVDGVHLNEKGYQVWKKKVINLIKI